MIPFAGWAATAGKLGKKAVKAADVAGTVVKDVAKYGDEAATIVKTVEKNADEVAELAVKNADEVAKTAKSTKGTAKINYYEGHQGPHWTVETKVPGKPKMETHQVITDSKRRATEVIEVNPGDFKRSPTKSVTVELPDADAARKMQMEQVGRGDMGPWVQKGPGANSCATAVCEVVSAGGGAFPSNPADAANFMRKLFNLPVL